MCGLVGTAGVIAHREKAAFRWLLHVDVLRGPHSTGIAAIHRKDQGADVTLMKQVGLPEDLYNAYALQFSMDSNYNGPAHALIGHNRWATQGAVTQENAHPFSFEHVVGAHNGTVDRWSLKDFVGHKEFDVDSQIIFAQLNDNPDLQHVWTNARGAMALVWYDKRDGNMHFARNKERTLYYAISKDNMSMFWASEIWMLRVILNKMNISYHDVFEFEEDHHYIFNVKGAIKWEKHKLTPFQNKIYDAQWWDEWDARQAARKQGNVVPFQGGQPKNNTIKIVEYDHIGPEPWRGVFIGQREDKQEVAILTTGNDQEQTYNNFMQRIKEGRPFFTYPAGRAWTSGGMLTVHAVALIHQQNLKVPDKEVKEGEGEPRKVTDFFGNPLSRKEWKQAACTCCICAQPIMWRNADKVTWIDPDTVACVDCKDTEIVQEYIKTFTEEA